MMIDDIKELFKNDISGHGFDHAVRVRDTALKLAQSEKDVDLNVITLATLLHDVDDYKLFGAKAAQNLTNARRIMTTNGIDNNTQKQVVDIIQTMGYSKTLKGIHPVSKEGQIVSDADMLDAMGAFGIVRTIAFSVAQNRPIFDATAFPETDLGNYTNITRKTNTAINHFFDKLLKLRGLLFTDSAKELAQQRHKIMVDFLSHFFEEQNLPDWQKLLENYK